jgi:hypothetical protein
MKTARTALLFAVLFSSFPAHVLAVDVPDTVPNIPEPMFFDLVRPLGARKGELEVNSLFVQPLAGQERDFQWAPEAEYAVTDGVAIEPQVIFENGRLLGGQFTVQKTLGTLFRDKAIHGVLARAEYLRPVRVSGEWLYLWGARINQKWSLFTIQGLRRDDFRGSGFFQALVNPSVFYDVTKDVTIGLETNFAIGQKPKNVYRFIPQVHVKMPKNTSIQYGVGLAQTNRQFAPSMIARVIWQVR